jgi:hypothetical protein
VIQFSQTLATLLKGESVETFVLVSVGDQHFTDFYTDLEFNGVTYLHGSSLLEVAPPQLTSTVDKANYKISFADPDFAFGTADPSTLTGQDVEARIGIADENGVPLLQADETIVIYKGRVDSVEYAVKTESSGESIFNLVCASPMADLDFKKPFYTNEYYQGRVDQDDTCFNSLYDGSQQVLLKWGKA